ncbi:MAG: hypothetical protein O3A51_10240, partial [Verrucomicrobia bacterium]|nr:hypothetical protein [Verrucomicrobiota bacterium]
VMIRRPFTRQLPGFLRRARRLGFWALSALFFLGVHSTSAHVCPNAEETVGKNGTVFGVIIDFNISDVTFESRNPAVATVTPASTQSDFVFFQNARCGNWVHDH